MTLLHKTGDIHGCNFTHSPSVKNHLRPADHHTSSNRIVNHVRVDHVESDVGESHDPCHIRSFQLPFSKSQRKDFK